MKAFIIGLILLGVGFFHSQTDHPIDIWYGNEQIFGNNGQAQYWINILGNVDRGMEWSEVSYQLNGSEDRPLNIGSDKHRLANYGDFNIEIAWEELKEGKNNIKISAKSSHDVSYSSNVIAIVNKGREWPLPYEVNFTKIGNLQEYVQVVDGKWRLTNEGVKTVEPYYDRVLSLGDTSWRNYQANIILSINGFTPPEEGPPTYNVTHFGTAFRWRGHVPTPNQQPYTKWYPLGAQGEFLLKNELDSCAWRILFDGGETAPPVKYTEIRNSLELGTKIRIKAEVETVENGNTRYRFKQWAFDQAEPEEWDIAGIEDGKKDFESGALCLVPHNSDVTIHSVKVYEINTKD